MADDSFTETTSTGWFSRIGNSIKGIVFGGILFVVAFPVLWWNEGRSVHTAQGLAEGEKIAVDVSADKVDPANEGRLVHTSGRAEGRDVVKDETFAVTAPGLIKLQREVELYQWIEKKTEKTEQKTGGSEQTTTTYSYSTGWDDKVHSSSNFKKKDGHENPPPAYSRAYFTSGNATLGAFRLPELLLSSWGDFKPHPVPSMESLPEAIRPKATVREGWLYIGGNPDSPKVGDARVKFESIPPGDASVLARQVKDTFEAYTTSFGTTIARIASGVQTKEAMFAAAKSENTLFTWLLRAGGFLLMFLGLSMVLAPLKVVADVLPFMGSIVGAGTTFIAFLLGFIGSCITIALAWLWYRPAIGIAMLLVAAGGLYLLVKALSKGKARAAA